MSGLYLRPPWRTDRNDIVYAHMTHDSLVIYTDGGARGNPGPSGIGVAIFDKDKKLIATHKEFIGYATNNQAEYKAVILALEKASVLGAKNINFFLDSLLVVKQLRGEFRMKNEGLKPLQQQVFRLSNKFSSINYSYVPREQNKVADKLVNEAIDEGINNVNKVF